MEVNPRALDIAKTLDRERERGKSRGPLHGIPILIKDNIATLPPMQTTAGSWSLLGAISPRNAFIIQKLEDAGAIVLGKTGMSEWASLRSRWHSDGYSARGGQVRNPFDLSRNPYGSSGGSAVSVSANVVPVSIGTETDGSISGPAVINSVVGIKPTTGITSRAGVIPSSTTQDTIGPFARTIKDAAIVLDVIKGVDRRDNATTVKGRKEEKSYASFATGKKALKGAKLGLVTKRCYEYQKPDHKLVAEVLFAKIRSEGAEIVNVDFPSAETRLREDGWWDWELGPVDQQEFTVVKAEAYGAMNDYLSELTNTPIKTFEDIVQFNKDNAGTEGPNPGDHPGFITGQDLFEDIIAWGGVKNETYWKAKEYIRHQTQDLGVDAALTYRGKKLDALILLDMSLTCQQIPAQAGYPTIHLPVGIDDRGMPIGISLFQTKWEEGELIRLASAIEDLVGGRPKPKFNSFLSKNIPTKSD